MVCRECRMNSYFRNNNTLNSDGKIKEVALNLNFIYNAFNHYPFLEYIYISLIEFAKSITV